MKRLVLLTVLTLAAFTTALAVPAKARADYYYCTPYAVSGGYQCLPVQSCIGWWPFQSCRTDWVWVYIGGGGGGGGVKIQGAESAE